MDVDEVEENLSDSYLDVSPPWGGLPVEQYLIRNWDLESSLPPHEQRQRLFEAFGHLAEIPQEWCMAESMLPKYGVGRRPTAEEIGTILAPLRSTKLRTHAARLWCERRHEAVILRTHYAADAETREEHDAKLGSWLDAEETEDEGETETREGRVLDDLQLFSYGEHWERVFEILPEAMADWRRPRRTIDWELIEKYKTELREELENTGYHVPEKFDGNRAAYLENIGWALQIAAEATYLIVADEEAFKTDKVRVLTLDGFGNVIKESRWLANDIHIVVSDSQAGRRADSEWWALRYQGKLDPKYRAYGEIGKTLYGVDEFFGTLTG